MSVICSNSVPDIESVTEALRTGPYGRCVYECDNDVCSNQVGESPIYLISDDVPFMFINRVEYIVSLLICCR